MAIDWPIGTPEERRAAVSNLPGAWQNSNPFATHYQLKPGLWQYHDGVDLNLNAPVFNSDWHKGLYAIDDGVVTYAGPGGGTWGHIVDTRHETKAGRFYVSRFGHVENTLVKTGDQVTAGQQVAAVGTGDGAFTAHLHWNISQLDDPIMLDKPNQWCGADLSCVLQHYIDPVQFVIDAKEGRPPLPSIITQAIALDNLVIRAEPRITAAKLSGRVDQFQIINVADLVMSVAYTKLADRTGYVSTGWIVPVERQTVRITADVLNVRALPNATAAVLDRFKAGRVVDVWGGSALGVYVKLADLPGWVSVAWIEPLIETPPALVDPIPDLNHFTVIDDPAVVYKSTPVLIHKGTQGVAFVDPEFRGRRDQFRIVNPGGDVIAWHNGTNHDAKEQAKHVLRTLCDGATGIALDVETISPEEGGTMTLAQAEEFVAYIHNVTGVWVAVYIRPGYFAAVESTLSLCPLWVASAHMPPVLPYQWLAKGWQLNQYDQRLIPGISKPVDINRFAGTLAQLKVFVKSISPLFVGPIPDPVPEPATEKLYIDADQLYLRPKPARAGGVTYPRGTAVGVVGDPVYDTEFEWRHVVVIGEPPKPADGWMAVRNIGTNEMFLVTTPPYNPPPVDNTVQVGFHYMAGGNAANVYEAMRRLKTAGKHLGGIVDVRLMWGGEPAVRDFKSVDPDVEVTLRWYWDQDHPDRYGLTIPDWRIADLRQAGYDFCKRFFEVFSDLDEARLATCVQLINEPLPGAGTASWLMGAFARAEELGVRLAYPMFSVASFPTMEEDNTGFWNSMFPVMDHAEAYGHRFSLHAYTIPQPFGPWNEKLGIMRHQVLLESPRWPARFKNIRIDLDEYGDILALQRGPDVFYGNLRTGIAALKATPNVHGRLWTVGSGSSPDWAKDRIDGEVLGVANVLING
jgi:GH25 family lysozyme M1 (1,4-beta-N-acetylmuramidase)